jgi:hypothetical protein
MIPAEHKLGLEPLWFTGKEWASGMAHRVLQQQFRDRVRTLRIRPQPKSGKTVDTSVPVLTATDKPALVILSEQPDT